MRDVSYIRVVIFAPSGEMTPENHLGNPERVPAPEPQPRTEGSLGEHLLDSMTELRAHLQGEIQLSEAVYHVPPETN